MVKNPAWLSIWLAALLAVTSVTLLYGDDNPGSDKTGEDTTPTKVDIKVETKVDAGPDVTAIFAGGVPKNLEDLLAMERHQQQLVKKITPATVGVRVGAAQGSGVIISPDGYVLTAAHVSGPANRPVEIILHDGRRVRGRTLGRYQSLDAGLIKIRPIVRDGEEIEWPFSEVGLSNSLKPGQWVMATGHPGGYKSDRPPVVRVGRVLSKRDSVLISDCKLVGGDSGGPLFDTNGRVIGIHSRIGNSLTTNMHVPVNVFMDSWDRLVDSEEWGATPGARPVIGVKGQADATQAKITHVYPGSPAEKAKLKVGDVVLTFGGKKVLDFPSLQQMVSESEPGKKVKLQVQRGDSKIELQLVIGSRR